MARDGRAAANSSVAVPFWNGWLGPLRWNWDTLSPERQHVREATGRYFVALAGLEWLLMQDAAENTRRLLDPRTFLQFRYEDFCAAKEDTLSLS